MDSSTVHPLLRRMIAIAALAVWAAPGAGAVAVGLHLALGRHHGDHHHAEDHRAAALELALAAVHGHRHDLEAIPDHEHPAPSGGGPNVAAVSLAAADPPPAGLVPCFTGPVSEAPSPARRAPPSPLYDTHCSLML